LVTHFILQKIRRKSVIYKNSNAVTRDRICGFMELCSTGGWAGFGRY